MGPGSVTYLPVRSQGARLFIGDAHACQGVGSCHDTYSDELSRLNTKKEIWRGNV
jgi:acetamidase/formamidase